MKKDNGIGWTLRTPKGEDILPPRSKQLTKKEVEELLAPARIKRKPKVSVTKGRKK